MDEGSIKAEAFSDNEEGACKVGEEIAEDSIKEEKYLNDEEAPLTEETVFLAAPIKVEYPLDDFVDESNEDVESPSQKANPSKGDDKPIVPITQERMEEDDDDQSENQQSEDGSTSSDLTSVQNSPRAHSSKEDPPKSTSSKVRIPSSPVNADSANTEFPYGLYGFLGQDGCVEAVEWIAEEFTAENQLQGRSETKENSSLLSSIGGMEEAAFACPTFTTIAGPKPTAISDIDSVSPPPSPESENSKKRKRQPEKWRKNVRKEQRNHGLEYISVNGKAMPEKKMKGPCACKFDCVHRITQAERQQQFRMFWRLGSSERQWEFIRARSDANPVKTRRPTKENGKDDLNGGDRRDEQRENREEDELGKERESGEELETGGKGKRRTVARTYFFFVENRKIKVCKTMFLNTLAIGNSYVNSAYSHVSVENGYVSSPSMMGKHKNQRKKATPAMIENIKEHSNLFPRVSSHFSRKRTRREYLDRKLSLTKMAELYRKWANEKGINKKDIASSRLYIDTVNRLFNLGFEKTKKDRCQFCLFMANKANSRTLKEKYKEKHALHLFNWHKARDMKEKDKADGQSREGVVTSSFDLQKQLPIPKSDSGPIFYKTPMHVSNMTFFNSNTRMGKCILWHEAIAKRGSSEISSCVLLYLLTLLQDGANDIRLYSGNCAGQNKNCVLFAMYVYFALKYSVSITHRYLEAGHSQTEADSIHGRIETSTKGDEIFDFQGWVDAVEAVKDELPKYTVTLLNSSEVYSFRDLVERQNWKTDIKGQPISWKRVRELHVDSKDSGLVKIRYQLEGPVITMSTHKVSHPINMKIYTPPRAYEGRISLTPKTRGDLQSMCDDLTIPETKQEFIKGVLAGTCPEEDDLTEPEYNTDEELCETDILAEEQRKDDLGAGSSTKDIYL